MNTPRWDAIRNKVSLKLITIPSGDQDGTYAKYIQPNWPEVTERPLSTINFGYFVRNGLPPENQVYVSPAWTRENILSRGLLGAQLRLFRRRVCRLWRNILVRRSQRAQVRWECLAPLMDRWIPPPRILHPHPSERFHATHPQ
jgi:hypothetical protein